MSAEERGATFGRWVSSFFEPAVHDLTEDMEILVPRTISTDPMKSPKVIGLSDEQYLAVVDPTVVQRTPGFLELKDLSVYRENAEHTLFDCRPHDPLSHLEVIIMWGTEGPSLIPFVTHRVLKFHQEASAAGKRARGIRFIQIEGGNNVVCLLCTSTILDN